MKPSPFRRPLQISTFFRKEAVDVLRQPRLLLTLVAGPFLIMAVFGIGYRDEPQPMKTLFVAPAGSPLLERVESYADAIGTYVEFAGTGNDEEAGRRMLEDGDVDLLVVFPDDPLHTVLTGERAPIQVIHTRLDPIERTAISFASRLAVDQINTQILATIVQGGQELAEPAGDVVTGTDAALSALEAAVASGDQQASRDALDRLSITVDRMSLSVRAAQALSAEVVGDGAVGTAGDELLGASQELSRAVEDLRAGGSSATSADVSRLRTLATTVHENFGELTTADPEVLVRPFASEVQLAVDDVGQVTDWYAPAAVVLMLQQFGVAFGALSFVRERQLGIVDLFRVAPVDATETLIGKYLAYLVIGGVIGALLTAMVVFLLDVPIAAGIGQVAAVMLLSLFASIGLGFAISLGSRTDAQAVQYSMTVLLASLFFSGFFLSLGQMGGAARFVGWLLPVTYGMRLLRDVMLRGTDLDNGIVIGLAAYGAVMFLIALLGTRRRLAGSR